MPNFIKLLIFPLVFTVSINAQIKISIGASGTQVPFVFKDGSGLITDITNAMNKVQSGFIFKFNPYPSQRLRVDLSSGNLHIAAFNNIRWSYDPNLVDSTYNVIHSRDLYIALKKEKRDQNFFNNVGKDLTVVVLGFHYRYADFTLNQDTLKQIFNTITTFSEPNVVKMILKDRAKIGIVSSSLLKYLKHIKKAQYDSLLISENADTEYSRHYLVSKKAPITVDQLNKILIQLYKNGTLSEIYNRYGLKAPKIPN